jgi:hypothetical protein
MSQAKTVKEVLIATEWILNHLEWVQHNFFLNDKGEGCCKQEAKSCCLVGAMQLVETDWQLYVQAREYLGHVAYEHIIAFNDKFGRTKQEVLELVRKGIESAP